MFIVFPALVISYSRNLWSFQIISMKEFSNLIWNRISLTYTYTHIHSFLVSFFLSLSNTQFEWTTSQLRKLKAAEMIILRPIAGIGLSGITSTVNYYKQNWKEHVIRNTFTTNQWKEEIWEDPWRGEGSAESGDGTGLRSTEYII